MPISPALRGIPLILALLDKNPKLRDGAEAHSLSRNMGNKAYTHLTGQVVAAYVQARLKPTHQLVGVARSHSLFVVTPLSGLPAWTAGERLAGPPVSGISQT